jgi:hypothetical protein
LNQIKTQFKVILVDEQNFEEVIVVEINNNRILKKWKLINMVT